MSAVVQVRVRESEAVSSPKPETVVAAPGPGRDDPLQLLREAIAQLNAPNGELPDQTQMTDLLAQVRETLERANVVAGAATQSEEFAGQAQFDKALEALDAGLAAYPGDLALMARRSDVEKLQRASQSAATVQTALEEAQWLLNQDRLDLAASFLKEKAAALPDQPALSVRLEEIEARLPQWVEDRHVQAALGRVAALEDLQQWQVALTVIEEALQSNSASAELTGEARRIRDRLADQERQARLARRLELIGQKISAQSWRQARTLLESTQKEFSGAPELKPLRREVDAGLKRSECEAIVTEARQCLADGELEQAEQVLRRGLESPGREPAIEALRGEIQSERKYRDELRTAQVLFGRRQLADAERVLSGLVAADRSDAQALLDAVRLARAETEEENLCERGREKALKMMQQQQYAQAIDLLRNLLSLFPDNPILQRDLAAAQSALSQEEPEVIEATEEEEMQPRVPETVAPPRFATIQPSRTDPAGTLLRGRRAAMAGAASLVLIAVGGAAWEFSRNTPLDRPVVAPATTRPPVAVSVPVSQPTPAAEPLPAPPAVTLQKTPPAPIVSAIRAEESPQPETAPRRPLKSFVPAAAKQTVAQSPVLPLPPENAGIVSVGAITSLPVGLAGPINAPAPPSAAPVQSAAPAPIPAPKAVPVASGFQDAQVVSRTLPTYPALAFQRRVSGMIQVEATIDERGAVRSAKALNGDPSLAGAAAQAVRTWKYKAATQNGRPVASTVTVQVEFRIKDDAGK